MVFGSMSAWVSRILSEVIFAGGVWYDNCMVFVFVGRKVVKGGHASESVVGLLIGVFE